MQADGVTHSPNRWLLFAFMRNEIVLLLKMAAVTYIFFPYSYCNNIQLWALIES